MAAGWAAIVSKSGAGPSCLPWGARCGGPMSGVVGHRDESPRPSRDVAMPLGEHLTQATREKILRGEYIDFFLFAVP